MGDIVLFLLVCALAAVGVTQPSPVYPKTVASFRDLKSVFDTARTNAQLWDGATIYVHKAGDHSIVSLYRGEPSIGSVASGADTKVLDAPITIAGITNGAIFVDPDGTVRVQNGWTPWTAVAAPPAACSTTVNVQSTYAGYPSFGSLDCSSTN